MQDSVITPWRRFIAVAGVFTLAAGDFWRYSLTWWGWGAIVLLLLVAAIVELVRARAQLHRLPITLLAFVAVATLSIAWSAYRLETLLGIAGMLVTVTFAAYLALVLGWEGTLSALRGGFRWILGLSILFELFVSLVIRHPITPLWVDYSDLDHIPNAFYWSRDLLLEGDRIQGIPGNSNLLGMDALLALIVFVTQAVQDPLRRARAIAWSALAALEIVLTRSSTVLVALAVAIGVMVVLGLLRLTRGTARIAAGVTVAVLAVVIPVVAFLQRDALLGLLGRSSDLTRRGDIWEVVWELAIQRPVLGFGWVGYWPPWVAPFKDLYEIGGVPVLAAHDAGLDVFLQLGAVGFVVFFALLVVTVVRVSTHAVRVPRAALPSAAAALALLVALLVQGLTESRLIIEIGFALLAVLLITRSHAASIGRSPEDAEEDADAPAPDEPHRVSLP